MHLRDEILRYKNADNRRNINIYIYKRYSYMKEIVNKTNFYSTLNTEH